MGGPATCRPSRTNPAGRFEPSKPAHIELGGTKEPWDLGNPRVPSYLPRTASNLSMTSNPSNPAHLTRNQVAEMLGVSEAMVRKLDRSGALHPVRDQSNRPRYRNEEVRALVSKRAQLRGRGSERTRPVLHLVPDGETPFSPQAGLEEHREDDEVLEFEADQAAEGVEGSERELVGQTAPPPVAPPAAPEPEPWSVLRLRLQRERQLLEAEQRELARVSWRRRREAQLAAKVRSQLVAAGWPIPVIVHLMPTVQATLARLTDPEIAGSVWPSWLAIRAACEAAGMSPPPPPWLWGCAPGGDGAWQPVPLRPVGPGD